MKTTPKYAIVKANLLHAADLAANMRQEDRDEVMALAGQTPEQAVGMSMAISEEVWAGLADGRVLCLFGTAKVTALGDMVCPWMLSTDELPKHARKFLRHSKDVIAYWRDRHMRLSNAVDARYMTAIRWLRWLGFTVHEAMPMGPNKAMFHRVTIGD